MASPRPHSRSSVGASIPARKRLLLGVLLTSVAWGSTALGDGYHTPFRNAREVKVWWTTQQADFPTSSTPALQGEKDSVRPCTPGSVPPQIRRAMGELLQTLRFFHAENVIKTEFPSITGKSFTSVHDQITKTLTDVGETGLPYLLQELGHEFEESKRPRWTPEKAQLLARRTTREYYEAALDRIQVFEGRLKDEDDPERVETLISGIEHIKSSIELRNLHALQSRLLTQYQSLRPRKKYKESLLKVVKALDVRACHCLLVAIPSAGKIAKERFQTLLVTAVRNGVRARGEPGWRTASLKRILPHFLEALETDDQDFAQTVAECLYLLTERRYGTNVELWRDFLSETFAPELAPALRPKKNTRRRPENPEPRNPR